MTVRPFTASSRWPAQGVDVDVLTADDGEQAIAQILEHRPDLVLADISMPGRNGYDARRAS